VTDTEVLVVDYKSNRPPPSDVFGTPVLYLQQMAAYRAVLTRIYPQKSIRCAILWTAAPTLFELPGDMLDPYAVDRAEPHT
jgi:ATP-dependent helicase/nuclease subunit A